jgi:hypothetical protein
LAKEKKSEDEDNDVTLGVYTSHQVNCPDGYKNMPILVEFKMNKITDEIKTMLTTKYSNDLYD